MHTFLVVLHVIAAVFLIGPLVAAPMTGLRALRVGDVSAVRDAARQTTLYGFLSLAVFGFGLLAVATEDDDYSFGTVWVSISMTLYILSLLLVLLVIAPSLVRAARLLDSPGSVQVNPVEGELPRSEAGTKPRSLAEQEPEVKGKLDAVRGRIAASGGILAVLMLITVVLMVVKPFGD
jgi:uncharacterized membrane protein